MTLQDFSIWLMKNSLLADSSIDKYARAIKTISNEMQDRKVISKSIVSMNMFELDMAIENIFENDYFIKKNKTGDNMYSSALKRFRYYYLQTLDSEEEHQEILSSINLSENSLTERDAIIKSRIGQGQYRKNILNKYNGRCIVTGIDIPKLLIASHIKPWSISANEERIDTDNGLLLSANMDRLFDSGLISFKNNGKIIISSMIGKANEKRLNVDKSIEADLKPTIKLLNYLEYHRDVIFIK